MRTLALMLLAMSMGHAKTLTVTQRGPGPDGIMAVVDSAQSGDLILFNLPQDSETVILESQLILSKNLSIDGSNILGSGKPVTLKVPTTYAEAKANPALAVSHHRAIKILKGKVSIRNLTLQGGQVSSYQTPGDSTFQDYFKGGALLIAGGDSTQVLLTKVTVSGSGVYDSSDYRLQDGSVSAEGGGIYNAATLTMDSCRILGNMVYSHIARGSANSLGGGVYNRGILTVRSCEFIGNTTFSRSNNYWLRPYGLSSGGGIYNVGYLEVHSSTFHRDTSFATANFDIDGQCIAEGAGLGNTGKLRVVNSTFQGNVTRSTVAGERSYARGYSYSQGAGISNTGSAEIASITVTGNAAFSYGESNSIGTGVGVHFLGETHILNSIITGNLAGATPSAPPIGTASDLSGDAGKLKAFSNLFGTAPHPDSVAKYGGTWGPGNQGNVAPTNAFGSFAPALADNGGPTLTLAIHARSPGAGNGIRVGEYRLGDTTHYNAYWNGAAWKTTTGADAVGVTEVTRDQRGTLRDSPPCMGAFYIAGALDNRDASRLPKSPEGDLDFEIRGTTLLVDNGTGRRLKATVFALDGSPIASHTFEAAFRFELTTLKTGVYLFRIEGLEGASRTWRFFKP